MADVTNKITDNSGLLDAKAIDEAIIENLKVKLTAQADALKTTLKDNDGREAYWYGFRDLDPSDDGEITEGEEPDAVALTPFERSAKVKQYGKPMKFTDLMLKHNKIGGLDIIAVDKLTTWASRVMNAKTYAAMVGQTLTVLCPKAVTVTLTGAFTDNTAAVTVTSSAVTSSDYITEALIEKAYVELEKRGVEKFADGYYHAQVDAQGASDIRQLNAWVDIAKYQQAQKVEKNEIGCIKGFKVFVGGDVPTTTLNTNVVCHNYFFYGQDAYGTVDVEGERGKPQIIKKELGYNDSMNLKAARAVKFEFAATVLCDTNATVNAPTSQRIVRIVAPTRIA